MTRLKEKSAVPVGRALFFLENDYYGTGEVLAFARLAATAAGAYRDRDDLYLKIVRQLTFGWGFFGRDADDSPVSTNANIGNSGLFDVVAQ